MSAKTIKSMIFGRPVGPKINDFAEACYSIIKGALEHGFTGLGVAGDFIHLDTRGSVPVMWTY